MFCNITLLRNVFPIQIDLLLYVIANIFSMLAFIHKVMNKVVITLTAVTLLSVIALVIQLSETVSAQQRQVQSILFVVQAARQSIQDPLPGHEPHQFVIAAPLRDDGKIYSGLASFTTSQPIGG